MKTSFLLALLLSCWSQVQAADDDGKELPPIERYDYGMPLDIERVLSVTPVPATCGVVPLEMLYRDSAGRLHRLQYRALARAVRGTEKRAQALSQRAAPSMIARTSPMACSR